MIAVIDYGAGNVRSVLNALAFIGAEAQLTRDPVAIASAERLILPGVGSYGSCIGTLRSYGLEPVLRQAVMERQIPFLGICVGMQMLSTVGLEGGTTAGLGWIAGTTRRIVPGAGQKLPHVGWSPIRMVHPHPVLVGLDGLDMYFTHSYQLVPDHPGDLLAHCDYGEPVTAAVGRGSILGVQFHPEKSGDQGLRLLENFLSWSVER